MHESAKINALKFVTKYINKKEPYILDVGSYNINGTLKEVCPVNSIYTGIDVELGDNVDCVIKDYNFPLEDNTFDVVMSSSTFEHCDFFWLVFLEMVRCVKPNGYIYINVPSSGYAHTFPIDAWRFYPDAGAVLSKWANFNNYNTVLAESYIDESSEYWKDNVIIIQKKSI